MLLYIERKVNSNAAANQTINEDEGVYREMKTKN